MKKGIKIETLQNAVSASANGISFNVQAHDSTIVEVLGTFTADVLFEISQDGTNWYSILGQNLTTGANTIKATAAGMFAVPVTGIKYFRARVDWTSGTSVTVKATAVDVPFSDIVNNSMASYLDSIKTQIDKLKFSGDALQTDGVFTGTIGNVTLQDSSENEYDSENPFPVVTASHPIYGYYYDKGSAPTLTRTDDAAGKNAAIGIDNEYASNDFDNLDIFGEIGEVQDSLGNFFIRIPKFYIRKKFGNGFAMVQISKTKYPGFYLPWCFWDFTNAKELPYIDIGKYKASLGDSDELQSIPDVYPLCNKNIVEFRTYAQNNNTAELLGYQQLDLHAVDVLRQLMHIEFGTLDIQTIARGYTEGRYSTDDKIIADAAATNSFVVSNTTGAYYEVGQTISVHLAGATISGLPNTYGLTITAIDADTPEAGQTTITVDGDPFDVNIDDYILNTGWKNGFSDNIAASSGCIGANDGKSPWAYRGIESPFGDMWQFVDGVNINNNQAWVCANADNYASNVFANPYEMIGYANANSNGNVQELELDKSYPYANFPITIGGSDTTYYAANYSQASGQKVARFGGLWSYARASGSSRWTLIASSSNAYVNNGGRLLRKPLS